jgi:hypothetical protein
MGLTPPGPDDSSGKNQSEPERSGSQGSLQEQDLWQQFAEAATSKAFCESWLSLQAGMLRGTRSALLLLGTPDTGPFSPAAIFPDATYNVTHLAKAAERALR